MIAASDSLISRHMNPASVSGEHLDVVIAEHLAAGDMARFRFAQHGIMRSLFGLLPFHFRGKVRQRQHHLIESAV